MELFDSLNTLYLVDCSPKQQAKTAVNLGIQVVRKELNATIISYHDKMPVVQDKIYFSCFYPLHIFNALYFIRNNKINPKEIKCIIGGQGVSGLQCLDEIFTVFKGEVTGWDYETKEDGIWCWDREIVTDPIITKQGAVIELSRGCENRCKFCQYSWLTGGKYREKSLELVKKQLLQISMIRPKGLVNVLTTDYLGLHNFNEIEEYVRVLDLRIMDIDKSLKHFWNIENYKAKHHNSVRICPESLSSDCRHKFGKNISDDDLYRSLYYCFLNYSYIDILLIYGLPEDNYEDWFCMIEKIGDLRRRQKNPIRLNIKITDFMPMYGTPYAESDPVDFVKKQTFIARWIEALKKEGIFTESMSGKHHLMSGLIGRRECSYMVEYKLRTSKTEITDVLMSSFRNGVRRWLEEKDCREFLEKVELERDRYGLVQLWK